MRYWKLHIDTMSPAATSRVHRIKSVPGTVRVLEGWTLYPENAAAARVITVLLFLDAGDRVLGIVASDSYMVE